MYSNFEGKIIFSYETKDYLLKVIYIFLIQVHVLQKGIEPLLKSFHF